MPIRSYRDLRVWERSVDLTVECYRLAGRLPRSEVYGLAGQIRRAAVSVPANIAEGHGRQSTKELVHDLSVAMGSLMELETHLLITGRLTYLRASELEPALSQASEVGRMLNGLISKLSASKSVPAGP